LPKRWDLVMTEPIMKRAEGDGVEIQLALWEGEGDPILCIHGLTANCRSWDRIASALTPDYPVLAVDLRGRGLSDKPEKGYCVELHMQDVHHVMENLALTQVHLMGHSLGAFVSLALAARYPHQVKKLILVDAAGRLTQAQWGKIETAIQPSLARLGQVFPSFEAYIQPLKQAPFLQPWTAFLDTYFRYELEEVEGGLRSRTQAAHILEEIAHIREFDAPALYSRIRCPVLILRATEGMVAEDDLLLPQDVVERMVREIPHARYADIPGTNHYSIVFDQNGMRDRSILEFLAG
jgi:pimeloyl-ACP methyl ester carboxylesterase